MLFITSSIETVRFISNEERDREAKSNANTQMRTPAILFTQCINDSARSSDGNEQQHESRETMQKSPKSKFKWAQQQLLEDARLLVGYTRKYTKECEESAWLSDSKSQRTHIIIQEAPVIEGYIFLMWLAKKSSTRWTPKEERQNMYRIAIKDK